MNRTLSLASLVLLAGAMLLPPAGAEAADRCYRFEIKESPARETNPHKRMETWCYRSLGVSGERFIFNADGEEVRPELAMTVNSDGVLTHGSLMAGKVTTHRVQSKAFNPFSVPLEEPMHLNPVAASHSPGFLASAEETLEELVSSESPVEEPGITEGEVTAASAYTPWRGYWWPYRGGPLYSGSSSPLAKLDRWVQARTGSNPGNQSWEAANHRYKGVWWEGHCNGWAAASILRSEPRSTRYDSRSGVSFSVSDQKGLLSVAD